MVYTKYILTTVLAVSVATTDAYPIHSKRIAQVISASTTKWVAACRTAGGGEQCGTISERAFTTLLAAGDPCAHQDAADAMVTFGKTLKNNANVISLAQIFVQQPRNAPDSLGVLYCQKKPANAELEGLFQCQFAGAKQDTFTGNLKVGAPGTIPLGFNAPLSPAGSCPASPKGPVADGTQLTDTVSDLGLANAVGGGSPPAAASPDPAASTGTVSSAPTASPASAAASPAAPAVAASATVDTSSTSFKKQNGLDAQKLNEQFGTLRAGASCTAGENACVTGQFAQCVAGKFVATGCAGGTTCAALPLVNSKGTSITCTTVADRDARIAEALKA